MTRIYRHEWYQQIYTRIPGIHEEARKMAQSLGLEPYRDQVGLYPGSSSCPGPLTRHVLNAIVAANRVPVYPARRAGEELRRVVKDIYGDEYDAAVANTCEAGLRITFETLFAPPTMRKGETYRARFLTPYGEDYEFPCAYGRPFPPKYKNLFADRTTSGGEHGVENKSLPNLDAVFVRLPGARYEPHGIKWNPVPLLTQVDHHQSAQRFQQVAARHAAELVGLTMVGYNTPGYGANEVDENGVPLLMKSLGSLAAEYDIPFVVDAAGSMPVFWPHLKDIGAHVMLWSTDKAARAPISGLIVGDWETMVQVRKSMGLGGGRYGEVSSHSKAVFSLADPGRDSIVGLTAVLTQLRDDPAKVTRPIDILHEIILAEFEQFSYPRFLKKMLFTKSYAYGGTEINYEQTWEDAEFGMPIFNLEDMFANTNPMMSALEEMGIFPATIYSGNIWVTPGLGTLNEEDELDEVKARMAVRALVKALEIVCRHAGLKEG